MRARSVKFFSQPYPQIFDGGFLPSRDVAQPGRALAWGARGRQFKSARPDQFFPLLLGFSASLRWFACASHFASCDVIVTLSSDSTAFRFACCLMWE
jgi:hypothetical protein